MTSAGAIAAISVFHKIATPADGLHILALLAWWPSSVSWPRSIFFLFPTALTAGAKADLHAPLRPARGNLLLIFCYS